MRTIGHGWAPAQTFARAVAPNDIAPILAAYLNIKFPFGVVRNPLEEVLGFQLGA